MTYDDWPYVVLLYLAFGITIGVLYWYGGRKAYGWRTKDLIDYIGIFALLWAPLPFMAGGWYIFEKIKQHIERRNE